MVSRTCNPSYSGGRNQEDQGLKSALANLLKTLSGKNSSQKKKRGLTKWLNVWALTSKSSTLKKKKEREKENKW
jgi:hypothetical protein